MKAAYFYSKYEQKKNKQTDYEEYKFHYKVNDELQEGYINIKYNFLDRYSSFIDSFAQIEYENSILYYRDTDNFMTNQSPVFIMICLIDNQITFDLYLETYHLLIFLIFALMFLLSNLCFPIYKIDRL